MVEGVGPDVIGYLSFENPARWQATRLTPSPHNYKQRRRAEDHRLSCKEITGDHQHACRPLRFCSAGSTGREYAPDGRLAGSAHWGACSSSETGDAGPPGGADRRNNYRALGWRAGECRLSATFGSSPKQAVFRRRAQTGRLSLLSFRVGAHWRAILIGRLFRQSLASRSDHARHPTRRSFLVVGEVTRPARAGGRSVIPCKEQGAGSNPAVGSRKARDVAQSGRAAFRSPFTRPRGPFYMSGASRFRAGGNKRGKIMTNDPLTGVGTQATPQSEQADPRQIPNSAGGYAFPVGGIERIRRFLVLGTAGGTFYIGERELTRENAGIVFEWAANRTVELVDEIVELSVSGRAPKQNPLIFALAAACSLGPDPVLDNKPALEKAIEDGWTDAEKLGRRYALGAIPKVIRTGTHMFIFCRYVEQFRGWGRGLRRAVSKWYLDTGVSDAAYQAVKYRQREGWTHRDVLRSAHPKAVQPSRKALFDWICGRESDEIPAIVDAFEVAQHATKTADFVHLVSTNPNLSWEMLPDTALTKPEIWEALIDAGIPQTALMRQLPRLTNLGLLAPMSHTGKIVAEQLVNPLRISKARIHPINVLIAMKTYAQGASMRGSTTWNPVSQISDALDAAFYLAFGNVTPTGKRTMLALDVSGSMAMWTIANLPLTPREATAALALVIAKTEPSYQIMAFADAFVPLDITPRMRLDTAINKVSSLRFGGTDCSLPMLYARTNKIDVDTFVTYTDNETWAGAMHPHEALRQYRNARVGDARHVVVGMTATDFTIADPDDPGQLDVAGFDSAVPQLIADFSSRAI